MFDLLKKKANLQRYLSIVDIELGRYQFRMNSIPTPSEIKIEYGEILNKPLQGRKSRRDPPNIIYGRGKNDIWK